MTREEQIKEVAEEIWNGSINSQEGITTDDLISMAKWADENPENITMWHDQITILDNSIEKLEQVIKLYEGALNKIINPPEKVGLGAGYSLFANIAANKVLAEGRKIMEGK